MDLKPVVENAKKLALTEIKKYGFPSEYNLNTSLNKAVGLAEELKVDVDIVKIGNYLMDVGLGKSFADGKVTNHIELGVRMANDFLEAFDFSEEIKAKIIACVREHHGVKKFSCLESEICANSDCYRFILPRNVLMIFHEIKGRMGKDFDGALEFVDRKLEEKWNILSLDICKKELEPHYRMFKELFRSALL